ncbi:MAG: amino acid permease, partial [Marinicaulis sp.]|nr:amino acid permease [Marinicaulis sp.]
DYSLAEAARPAFGQFGLWFTVAIAIIATTSGLLASIFAVSRMLTMLTDMKLIPHKHFGMPGGIQKHTLVYTVILAAFLAAFFDLSRIASLGAILYLVMDIVIQWGVFRHLRKDVGARAWILITAIVLDFIVLGAFLVLKANTDPAIIVIAGGAIALIFAFEKFYLGRNRKEDAPPAHQHGQT